MAFVDRHPVLAFFVVTFALSWGGMLFVAGPGAFTGSTVPAQDQLALLFLAMLVGPGTAAIGLTATLRGREGLRNLLGNLSSWQVGLRWYVMAVLGPPSLMTASLMGLSLFSPEFVPGVFQAEDRAPLVVAAILGGLAAGLLEEIGWTGFAVPRLGMRHGVLVTGLVVGALWGAWHYPLFATGDPSGSVPALLFLPALLFTHLPAFRVMMVWLHGATGSLLLVVLMHMSVTAGTMLLQPLSLDGVSAVIYNLVLTAALWLIIAAVAASPYGTLVEPRATTVADPEAMSR